MIKKKSKQSFLNGIKCACSGKFFKKKFFYNEDKRYFYKCILCSHYSSKTLSDNRLFYNKKYFDKTYKSLDLLKKRIFFLKKLNFKQSDNKNRVKRIVNFLSKKKKLQKVKLLDVGSGTGIFLHEIKKVGYNSLGIDLDKRYSILAKKLLGVKILTKKLKDLKIKQKFDIITFNKVLEHIRRPGEIIKLAKKFLKKSGHIYIELPDSFAEIEGKNRQEFCKEHFHVFSIASFNNFILRNGFLPVIIERIREPSGKFTLYGFVKNKI